MQYISTDKAPAAVGPYSQGITSNGLLFLSGQIGLDPQSQKLVEGFEQQTHQVLKNLKAVLQEADLDLEHVIKTTVYLSDITNFKAMNEIYGQYFTIHKPVRAAFAVAALPAGALIEIEAIAQQTI